MSWRAQTYGGTVGLATRLSPWFHTPSDPNPNHLYVGNVLLPGLQKQVPAYVKVFPKPLRGQLVFNEVLGHHVALQCGLTSPHTFPCACDVRFLSPRLREVVSKEGDSEYILGLASVDANPGKVSQSFHMSDAVIADLLNWPYVARAAVFDELVGNDDRHNANLVRCGEHNYVVIDHERLLFGGRWFDADLASFKQQRCDSNVLADTISMGTDELMRRRMMQVAQHLVRETLLTVPAEVQAIEEICGAPREASKHVIELLNARRAHLPTLMQWHVQKGDLFQASTAR